MSITSINCSTRALSVHDQQAQGPRRKNIGPHCCDPHVVLAGDYPVRSVRLVLGLSPGGSVDIVTRIVAEALSEFLGQQFIVEKKPGAVFAIAFAMIYAPTMDYNWTLATYHPIQGIWQFGRAPPLAGGSPAMYWYGFVITAALGALVLTGLVALVPDKLLERVPWRNLTWIVILCSIAYITYVLLPYAIKT